MIHRAPLRLGLGVHSSMNQRRLCVQHSSWLPALDGTESRQHGQFLISPYIRCRPVAAHRERNGRRHLNSSRRHLSSTTPLTALDCSFTTGQGSGVRDCNTRHSHTKRTSALRTFHQQSQSPSSNISHIFSLHPAINSTSSHITQPCV